VSDRVLVHALADDLQVTDALSRFAQEDFCLLLDSASRPRARDARYTFLTADPVARTRLESVRHGDKPFTCLREWRRRLPHVLRDDVPPFCGGIAGLMSYELGAAFERMTTDGIDEFRTPALLAGLFDWCIVWDHLLQTVQCWVLQLDDLPGDVSDSERPAGGDRLQWVLQRLSDSSPSAPHAGSGQTLAVNPDAKWPTELSESVFSDFSRDRYLDAVSRVIEYIRAGDIFQANLSQRLVAPWAGTAEQLFRRVRECNPAPFCSLLSTPEMAVVSASPERFLHVSQAGLVETRPIKGTRRRQKSPIADLFTSDALVASDKDRAENVMIVDLLRNDISRVCRPGTVRVTGLCEVEAFETVQHLVSTVEGQLRTECDVWDLITGCFPGGSITGAPKIRSMEIISELEPTVRGAYCGSLFFQGPNGTFDSSILIRTFTLKEGWLQFPVGGGIVADSDPRDEYWETLHKAAGMLKSLATTSSD